MTNQPTFTVEYSTSFVNEETGYAVWLFIEGPAGLKAQHCGWAHSQYGATIEAAHAAERMRELLIGITGQTVLVKRGEIEKVA
jgi:hypothetical protein